MNQPKSGTLAKQRVLLELRSRAPSRRPAFLLTVIVLCTAWLLGAALTVLAAIGVSRGQYVPVAIVFLLLGLGLLAYCVWFTRKYVSDFLRNYILEFTNDEARLKILDKPSGHGFIARMPWREIDYAEYFSPRDNATIVLHGKDGRLIEIPIWTMTDDPEPVLDFLSARGVPVRKTI